MGVRLNQGWRLKVLRCSLTSQTPASLASGTTANESVFVPRLSSLLFGGDMETAVVMAVQKLGYIEPTLEQSEALQGKLLGYATRQATRAQLVSLCKDCLRIHTQHVLRM